MVRAFVIGLLTLLSAPAIAVAAPPKDALNHLFPELQFDNVTLLDAIDALRDLTQANIHVDWNAIEPLGVTRESTVSVSLRRVTLRTALNLILRDVGKGQLTFFSEDGVIEITARTQADQRLHTRVYFIGDLLMEIPDFQGPRFGLANRADGAENRQLIEDKGDEQSAAKSERADDLVGLIVDTIRPEVWRQNGGPASIRYFRDHLIITAPRSVHESIGGPLP